MAKRDALTESLMSSFLGKPVDVAEVFDGMDPQSHGAEIENVTIKKKEIKKPTKYAGMESAPENKVEEAYSENGKDSESDKGKKWKKMTKKEMFEFEFEDHTLILEKEKGVDGKACWKGYKYAGTENGKDKCVPMKKEDLDFYTNILISEEIITEKLDPVGKEDKDIDNDGDHDKSDKYLHSRRKKVSKIISTNKKMKEEIELEQEILGEKKSSVEVMPEIPNENSPAFKKKVESSKKYISQSAVRKEDVEVGDAETLEEKAPPGSKYERMVKHIKKGYSKDEELTKKETGTAYATAWKSKKKEVKEESEKEKEVKHEDEKEDKSLIKKMVKKEMKKKD